jgi:hypothetical protein
MEGVYLWAREGFKHRLEQAAGRWQCHKRFILR